MSFPYSKIDQLQELISARARIRAANEPSYNSAYVDTSRIPIRLGEDNRLLIEIIQITGTNTTPRGIIVKNFLNILYQLEDRYLNMKEIDMNY